MRSVRLEPTNFILMGTRTTYQATGDAGTDLYSLLLIFNSTMACCCSIALSALHYMKQ